LIPTADLTTLVGLLGDVFTFLLGQFGSIFALWLDNPVLVVSFGIMVTGAVIGLVMRVIHRN
jgi:hypothetical protein